VFFKPNNQRKENPSLHQKQMRFFTVFFLVIVLVLFAALLWLVNRSSYPTH
jgi:flagellar biogenesis protein FliO